VKFGPLLRRSADTALSRLLPAGARAYRTTIISNADDHTAEAVERMTEAGETAEHTRSLGLTYPEGLYSLSHVALPFPMTDSLYGLKPDPADEFGINLGALAPRGERNVLIASLDALLRVASNPFFPYMLGRIEEGMDGRKASVAAAAPTPAPNASDEKSDWSFWDDLAFILQLGPDQSDPEAAPP
jgi:hypothetical protein